MQIFISNLLSEGNQSMIYVTRVEIITARPPHGEFQLPHV